MSIFHNLRSSIVKFKSRLREHFDDVLYIWRHEMVKVVKDEGVAMFLVIVPLGYPLL